MSRSKRNQRTYTEVPMPERPRLEVTPDFVPFISVVCTPDHDPHYRTTHMVEPMFWAYVEVETLAQRDCTSHRFTSIDRFGHGPCAKCRAWAWADAWVADGLYADGTMAWIETVRAEYINLTQSEVQS